MSEIRHKNSVEYNNLLNLWGPSEKRDRGASGPSGHRFRKFDDGEIITWDGEGINTHPIDENTMGSDMILFANSLGEYIGSEARQQLTTKQCLDFMIDTARRHPKALHFIYGGGWDFTHILRGLPRRNMLQLMQKSNSFFHRKTHYAGYTIYYVPRREFHVIKYGWRKNTETGETEKYVETSIKIWDVVGFFQNTFVKALDGWLGNDYQDRDLIVSGKALRDEFYKMPWDFILRYNMAELRLLAELMERFREAVSRIELRLNRWDGAGALAAAMLKKYGLKAHIADDRTYSENLRTATRCAYTGGRVEDAQIGVYYGTVYNYDINSAYPSAMLHLPSLTNGHWECLKAPNVKELPEFSIVLIAWHFKRKRFYPFPYRNKKGQISYPQSGKNWVWTPEIDAYLSSNPDAKDQVEYLEAWAFYPDDVTLFPFVPVVVDHYRYRQDIINGLHPEIPTACEKPIKLGVNSLYGKLAQNAGYNPETQRIPAFHCLPYAGFITSYTRAKVYHAAMQSPDSIIAIATDGLFTTLPLDLPVSDKKDLGLWECKTHDGMLIIQSGLYFFYDEGKGYTLRSRGVDRPESPQEVESLVQRTVDGFNGNDYTNNQYEPMRVHMTRFVTPGAALTSLNWWKRYAGWYSIEKRIDMRFSPSNKRSWDRNSNGRPSQGLCMSYPAMNLLAYPVITMGKPLANIPLSEPYRMPWDFNPDYYKEIEEEGHESMEGLYYER